MDTPAEVPRRIRVRFTSVSPELKDWLRTSAGAAS
jgi:hypothetical protein